MRTFGETEKFVQNMVKNKNVNGEWFELTNDEVQEVIKFLTNLVLENPYI